MADSPRQAGDDFTSLFEFLPIGAYRSAPDGRQLRANPALVRLNAFDTEAEHLAAVHDIATEWYVDPGRRAEFLRRLMQDGRVLAFESEIYRQKTHERIWVNENAHLVRGAAGEVLYFEGTVEEITERVRDREALRRSQEQMQQIIELVPGAVYRLLMLPGGGRRFSFISPGVKALYGVEPAAALADAQAIYSLHHPEDRARVQAQGRAAASAHGPLATELRIRLADGVEKWIQLISSAAPAEDGSDVRVGMVFDITGRKQAEAALRANSELWKRALESTGDGVWDWQVQDGVEILSAKCKALYGYTEDELLDRPELQDRPDALDYRTHPDDIPQMLADRHAHFAGLTPAYVNEHRVRCKNGEWKWILSRGIVISRDAAGRPLRMIGTHTDLTAVKQADALRFERDRAAAADMAKSQFLSRVSHELRTPLNAILGFAQLLEMDPGVGERQTSWLAQVLASGRHLLALVDDILDLSSVQTGQLPLNTEALALHPVLEEARAMVAAAAQEAGVVVINEVPADAHHTVRADRKRLKQIVSNLLSNAIKYNHRGGWVRLAARHDDGMVELSVADSGPGLDEAQTARLFNPFERLHAQRGPVAGTGLGLALTRQFAQAMGGSVQVSSRLGEGSTFFVRLPAA
jgi:PAS domain S-box-containing protein